MYFGTFMHFCFGWFGLGSLYFGGFCLFGGLFYLFCFGVCLCLDILEFAFSFVVYLFCCCDIWDLFLVVWCNTVSAFRCLWFLIGLVCVCFGILRLF